MRGAVHRAAAPRCLAPRLRRLRCHRVPQPAAGRRRPAPVTGDDGTGDDRTGLVVITRTIEPCLGGTALPGGFIDHDEDWKHAVVRELREETGIEADRDDVRLADALSDPDGHLLLFGLLPERPAAALPPSVPTEETSGYGVLRSPEPLAFPLHTEAVRAWFAGRYR